MRRRPSTCCGLAAKLGFFLQEPVSWSLRPRYQKERTLAGVRTRCRTGSMESDTTPPLNLSRQRVATANLVSFTETSGKGTWESTRRLATPSSSMLVPITPTMKWNWATGDANSVPSSDPRCTRNTTYDTIPQQSQLMSLTIEIACTASRELSTTPPATQAAF